MAEELLVSVVEAARRLSIARSHVYQHLQNGTLPSIQIGRARRIEVRELDAFVERMRENSTVAAVAWNPWRS